MTKVIERKLKKNCELAHETGETGDVVVKFFTPWANATWLITEYDENEESFFGLCDLGLGSPELGYVSRAELESLKHFSGLKVERDRNFEADKTLSEYADEARAKGAIYA